MRLMSFLKLSVMGNSWLVMLQNLVDLDDKPRSVLALCIVQIYCYHIWRERNARAYNSGIFGPSKLLQCIIRDFMARLHGSIWFSKLACSMPDLQYCIFYYFHVVFSPDFYLLSFLKIGYR